MLRIRRRRRPPPISLVAVVVVVLVIGASCSDDEPDASRTTTTTTADPVCLPPDPAGCTLAAAGAEAGVVVGTAGKWSSPERIELQAREFSALTNENELLWSVVHPEADTWEWDGADRVVDFADEHDMELTVTHFVWDPPSIPEIVPDWVRDVTDPDELRAVMRTHLEGLHERYGPSVDRLNVVNEPLAPDGGLEQQSHYLAVLGPDYVAEAFAMAEEIWPEAELILNENFVEYAPAKAEALVTMAEDLVARDVPIDGVGIQAHLFLGEADWATLEDTMRRIGDLGLDVAVTELDAPLTGPDDTLDAQAERARRVVEVCLSVPSCSSITFWGFDDGDTWLDSFLRPGTNPLLFDADLEPKPMYDEVLDALLEGRP